MKKVIIKSPGDILANVPALEVIAGTPALDLTVEIENTISSPLTFSCGDSLVNNLDSTSTSEVLTSSVTAVRVDAVVGMDTCAVSTSRPLADTTSYQDNFILAATSAQVDATLATEVLS